MRLLGLILCISFIAIAVFGFVAMGHEGCIMAIAMQNSCMQGQGPLAEAANHLQVYQNFSLAIFSAILTLIGLWRVAMHRFYILDTLAYFTAPHAHTSLDIVREGALRMAPRLLAWMSIHEKRDPTVCAPTGA